MKLTEAEKARILEERARLRDYKLHMERTHELNRLVSLHSPLVALQKEKDRINRSLRKVEKAYSEEYNKFYKKFWGKFK